MPSKTEPNDANAMALATVDEEGLPNVRMVLLKAVDGRGFVFYTNFESQKGHELLSARKAALCFHWKSLRRQVQGERARRNGERCRGRCLFRLAPARQPHRRLGVAAVAPAERPLRARNRGRHVHGARYAIGEVPRPPYWSGFRVRPGLDRVLA